MKNEFVYGDKNLINWSVPYTLSLIEQHADQLTSWDWSLISRYQKLNGDFALKYADKLNWNYICLFQEMTEEFIESNLQYMNWAAICHNQPVSEDFLEKHIDKVNWMALSIRTIPISYDFCVRYQKELSVWQLNFVYNN